MKRADLEQLLKANPGRFYVYLLSKPDGTPFYVGKGTGRRVFQHETDARGPERSHKLNTIRQLSTLGHVINYSIIDFFDCESECHACEMEHIRKFGRHDLKRGPLTNLTDGGEGTIGLSDDTKARIDLELHSEDASGDRGIANRFFFELCDAVRSVPIRPLGQIAKPRALPAFAPVGKSPTSRQAAALAASAIANRVLVEKGALIPRRMLVHEAPMIIEFGASKNVLESGLAALSHLSRPTHEVFELTPMGFEAMIQLIDSDLLLSAGVLMPTASPRLPADQKAS